MLYDKIIKEILKKRDIVTDAEIEQFLNPSVKDFYNPFNLNNMTEVCNRINDAIENKETVLIYGDYDADGICSVSMLYLYLQKRGVNVIAFIPNRHTDGYGLSDETVELIADNYMPDLVITVDTGISAKNQIETLLDLGIDCIVTDHHEPADILPNCLIIDPKISGQKYEFNGLSGAGVAFKLIQALGGLNEALSYVDICAISTVGDIVPLISENRIITILGLEKINSKNARPSIACLKEKLKLNQITSTDISFKIVPRLNASGRMDSAFKCFEFLIETDAIVLNELYEQIEQDNTDRLVQSQEIQEKVNGYLTNIDFNTTSAIFIKDDNINLGLIGIIASRLVAQYNKTVFVFGKDDDGMYKASIRSTDSVNIFDCINKYRDMLIDVGGHSQAGGLTINPNNYEEFKTNILKDLAELSVNNKIETNLEYDAEINESDINLNLVSAINKLEPFGFRNPRPQFLLKLNKANFMPMKSYLHFKIITPTKKEIISFYGAKYKAFFDTDATKELVITLEEDNYFKSPKVKAMLKNIKCSAEANDNEVVNKLKAIYNIFNSIGMENKKIEFIDDYASLNEYAKQLYGTIIIANNYKTATSMAERFNLQIINYPMVDGRTAILYNNSQYINLNNFLMYKNIAFVDGYFSEKEFGYLPNCKIIVYNKVNELTNELVTRDVFAEYYKVLLKALPVKANDFIENVNIICNNKNLDPFKMGVAVLVSAELGFVNLSADGDFCLSHNAKPIKRELSESEVLKAINKGN